MLFRTRALSAFRGSGRLFLYCSYWLSLADQAVNLGDDADTVGAVTGQLAGAVYGESSIPDRWLDHLAWRNEMKGLAKMLIGS
jgi:ADP-ribosylglycohydrolase